ncbi:MAG: hypothetical protein ACMG6S_06335 [Byssovorax sp.]
MKISSLRALTVLFPLIAAGAALFAGCASPTSSSDEPVAEVDQALSAEQCEYFEADGKVQICHHTSSTTHPYTILKLSDQACINAHANDPGDYIAVNDPTCQGGGCLPLNAPCDATLPCCDGLSCQDGTCQSSAPPEPTCPCAGSPSWDNALTLPADECGTDYGATLDLYYDNYHGEAILYASNSSCEAGILNGDQVTHVGLSPAEFNICYAQLAARCP